MNKKDDTLEVVQDLVLLEFYDMFLEELPEILPK
jgi:hypothetical protein